MTTDKLDGYVPCVGQLIEQFPNGHVDIGVVVVAVVVVHLVTHIPLYNKSNDIVSMISWVVVLTNALLGMKDSYVVVVVLALF